MSIKYPPFLHNFILKQRELAKQREQLFNLKWRLNYFQEKRPEMEQAKEIMERQVGFKEGKEQYELKKKLEKQEKELQKNRENAETLQTNISQVEEMIKIIRKS